MKRFWPILISLFFILLLVFYLSSRVLAFFRPYLPFTNYLLGVNKPTSYLVLLGNDAEMRANGGFAGSYAKLTFSPSVIPSKVEGSPSTVIPGSTRNLYKLISHPPNINLSFQDIYVPNGQIAGLYVTPPEPIQLAFGHGSWELANADWEPDFPSSAKSLRWFLEKGKETNPDILAILNLSTIKKVLNLVGSFPVPEYKATLTPDNLYLFLQGKAELNFFPGSTQKKDALTAVGHALVKKIKTLSFLQKFKIAQILYVDLQNQNIVLNSLNSDFQNFLVERNFAGVLQPEALDTYSMIEMNLGANKANAFVTRQTTHTVTFNSQSPLSKGEAAEPRGISPPAPSSPVGAIQESPTASTQGVILADAGIHPENYIHHSVTIKFHNSSLAANPNPPFDYGGNYIAYLRLYLPENAQNITLTRTPEGKPPLDISPTPTSHSRPDRESIQINSDSPSPLLPTPSTNNFALRTTYGLTELGFWHTTTAGNESTVSLTYDLPCDSSLRAKRGNLTPPCPYTLAILKQHGLVSSPQTITLFGQLKATDLSQSYFLP